MIQCSMIAIIYQLQFTGKNINHMSAKTTSLLFEMIFTLLLQRILFLFLKPCYSIIKSKSYLRKIR